jgi:hypothetical protein
MNPGLDWVREEPMVRLELTTSGLQIRFSVYFDSVGESK